MGDLPLSGYSVVDFGHGRAASQATLFLQQLGAAVTKVTVAGEPTMFSPVDEALWKVHADMVKQAHEAPKQFLRIGARPLTVANEERVGMVSSARLSVETGPCTRYSDRNALTTGGGLFLSRRVHYVQDVYFRYLSHLGGGGLRPVSDNMPDMFP